MRNKLLAALSVAAVAFGGTANAASIIADEVIDFFDSGAGPIAGPYGGTFPGTGNVPVPLSHAVDGNDTTYVSLPTGTFIIVKFNSGVVVDGMGDDLFIDEVGNGAENATIEVSEDGINFFSVGTAFGDQTSNFDLSSVFANHGLAFVQFVKVTGLDNGGSVPGFDLTLVEGLEGSIAPPPEVPVPAAALLFGPVIAAFVARRKKR